ncbi:MFS transporter [Pediococcus stilesii]|uniref:Major facilitator superfamily transporter permease n=1 Tax=Pediococcus stilesii TaxID=331679 RepID=A0A0R2KWQ7_9LACO|nr:MFS transporter [Pediococcus stilesii]KRN93913.1 major facilitator superfamily transporter permease [Pediococcus stilesii]
MEKIHQWFNQIRYGEYSRALILLSGIIIMLTGEFSTTLPVAAILKKIGDGGTLVQLINILPLAILSLMFPIGPVWFKKGKIVKTFQNSLILFAIGTLIIGVSPNLAFLMIGRIIQAIGTGMVLPMLPTLIISLLPEHSRFASFYQIEDVILGFSAICALIITGCAMLLGNWKYVNLFIIILTLIVYYSASYIKINLEVSSRHIEWLNALFSGGLLLIIGWLVTLTKTGTHIPKWSSWFFFISGILFFTIYIWRELHVDPPLIDFRNLFNIRYLRGLILQGIGASSLVVLMIIGVLYLSQGLRYPIFLTGIALVPSILIMIGFHHFTKKLLSRMNLVSRARIAMGIMMFGWGCLSIFSAHLHMMLFVILTMIIEAGHGLLIQVGKNLSKDQKSEYLVKMADVFTAQFKLMTSALVLTILSVVLQNVTENQTASALPGKLSSLLGYRAAFLIFFIITIVGWIITMIAGRNFNLSKYFMKRK